MLLISLDVYTPTHTPQVYLYAFKALPKGRKKTNKQEQNHRKQRLTSFMKTAVPSGGTNASFLGLDDWTELGVFPDMEEE